MHRLEMQLKDTESEKTAPDTTVTGNWMGKTDKLRATGQLLVMIVVVAVLKSD